ncbi:MAG: hypothetical protein A2521_14210 [Deltaproteobacteria bacterium RIFOXYD12_FULL_57_12]|nr:MAG: hypothetical protein A2521_14210 [Deltaproteobacteria bacterium RIFOXYD12_FULL_57_12]
MEEEVRKRTSELMQRGLELEKAYKTLQEEVEYRRKAEETVNKINLELTMLSDCIHAVVRASDETDLIKEICRIIVEVGQYSMAWVGFAEQDEAKNINTVAAVGIEKVYLENVRMTWGDTETGRGPTGQAFRSGEPAINTDTRTNPEMSPWREEALKRGYLSSVALPMAGAGKVFGTLNIYAAEVDAFDHYEVQRLREVANDLAYGVIALRTREERNLAGVELQANLEKLQAALEGTVKVVASTVEVRDPYTAGHQKRVANLAKKIAEKMGLPPETVDGVYMAGLVHDLGKIYVPAEILSKPSLLADIEFNLIKTHPRVGFDLLNTIDFPWPIAKIVHQHHEKMNGSGYPAGLAGEEILLEARIITVADVVEAMGSHRPYRPSLGLERALSQIREQRGILYDSQVVDVCLDLFATAEFSFE